MAARGTAHVTASARRVGRDDLEAVRGMASIFSRVDQRRCEQAVHDVQDRLLGAAATAQQLAALPAWQRAQVLKANPDQAQLPVRALREGKLIYMAVPKLADPLPFFRLDPTEFEDEP